MKLRRDTFIVFEDDPGFDSSVLIFVDIVVIRNPMIYQQMVDLDYTVSSTATSMCLKTIYLYTYLYYTNDDM